MTTLTLSRTEASFLQAAAAAEGHLHFAATMKPTSRERLVGRFLRDGLITPLDPQDGQHRLTAAGYQAIGLTPPKCGPAVQGAPGDPRVSKKAQVLALLAQGEGATLAELMAATGWLPHTVRAALSRLRTGGQPLLRIARADAAMAYRIPPAVEPPVKRPRRARAGATSQTAGTSVEAAV